MIEVVIVDDHPAVQAGLHTLLRGEPGIRPVAVADNVRDGLAAVRRHRPDVALVDFQLGDGDGNEKELEARIEQIAGRLLPREPTWR